MLPGVLLRIFFTLFRMFGGIQLLMRMFSSHRVPTWVKLLIPLALVYFVFPRDLIPDFVPVLGIVDDILILSIAVYAVFRLLPRLRLAADPQRNQRRGPDGKTIVDGDYELLDEEEDIDDEPER